MIFYLEFLGAGTSATRSSRSRATGCRARTAPASSSLEKDERRAAPHEGPNMFRVASGKGRRRPRCHMTVAAKYARST